MITTEGEVIMENEPEYRLDEMIFLLWKRVIPVAVELGTEGEDMWVPVRPVSEMVGVDPSSQLAMLKASKRYSRHLREKIGMRIKGVHREYTCLHRSMVGRWLDDIEPSKVRKDAAATLEQYRDAVTRELDRLLTKYSGPAGRMSIKDVQRNHVTSFTFVCECGRGWRFTDDQGDLYVEGLPGDEE
jgi:hypothetical protein